MDRRSRSLAASALLLLVSVAGCASSTETYLIKPVYTNVTFKITKWMVLPEQGQFRELDGTVTFHPLKPEQSHIEMSVQAARIDTKNDTRDNVLRAEDFFDVARFPPLRFRSTPACAN